MVWRWAVLWSAIAAIALALLASTRVANRLSQQSGVGRAMDSHSQYGNGRCTNHDSPSLYLPSECYADPASYVTLTVDAMRFRIPAAYFGPHLLKATTERENIAPLTAFPFWMPDGRPSLRDMGFDNHRKWRKPEEGWPPLRDDQHVVMVRSLRPLRPGDGNLTPYETLKQMRAQFSDGWPRQEDEFGLAKFKHLAAPENFEYATFDDGDQQVRITCYRRIKFPHGLFDCQGFFYSRPDELLFNIQFLADYMKDWRAITDQALNLARAWKAAGEIKQQ
ncbi:MAG: hypothetical protein HOP09_03770 [Hyphomicrobium sp.]|nr:hypothetical protein [Hyphomicrobium sp.]